MSPIPTLDELADNPGKAAALPPEVARALTLRCAAVLAALASASAASNGQGAAEAQTEDRLLDVKEAAERLGTSRDYLYRHAKRLPFTVRLGSRVRFSSAGIARYIRARQGR